MTALTDNRLDSKRYNGRREQCSVAADAVIYSGAMVAINASGYLEPATTADDIVVVGVATQAMDNTGGSNGDVTCEFERGLWLMDNSTSGDLIALVNVGSPCYAVDDRKVALTSNSDARSVAGTIHWVNSDGVVVRFD